MKAAKSGSKSRPANSSIASRKRAYQRQVGEVLRVLESQHATATPEALKRVDRLLTRMVMGSEVDLRTPFYTRRDTKGKLIYPDRDDVIRKFDDLVTAYSFSENEQSLLRLLKQIEGEQREMIGPWSPFAPYPEDGPVKAHAVYSDKVFGRKFNPKAWKRALDRLQSLIPTSSLGMLSIEDAIHGVPSGTDEDPDVGMDLDTNSGLPYAISPWFPRESLSPRKKQEVSDAYNYYVKASREIIESAQAGTVALPASYALAGQRLVQKGPEKFNPKSKRLVQAMPKWEAIVCKTFTVPMMEKMKEWTLRIPIMVGWQNTEAVDRAMQVALSNEKVANRKLLGGDISAFDASVPPQVLTDVGYVMATWVRGGEKLVRAMVDNMVKHTSYVTPVEIIDAVVSSMKSGSGETSIIGSNSNIAMQFYGEEMGLYVIDTLTVLGDDFTLGGKGVSPDATAETFSHFNMVSHPDKQFYEDSAVVFLQRLHYLGRPGGIYPVYRALGHSLSLERMAHSRFDWNKYNYVIRALAQIENCVFNPYFPVLLQFLRDGDKLQLGADLKDPMELINRAGIAYKDYVGVDRNRPWATKPRSFSNWLTNGVLRGETYPQTAAKLWQRVYGSEF